MMYPNSSEYGGDQRVVGAIASIRCAEIETKIGPTDRQLVPWVREDPRKTAGGPGRADKEFGYLGTKGTDKEKRGP